MVSCGKHRTLWCPGVNLNRVVLCRMHYKMGRFEVVGWYFAWLGWITETVSVEFGVE